MFSEWLDDGFSSSYHPTVICVVIRLRLRRDPLVDRSIPAACSALGDMR
ncbi:MAG: hypothetical protein HN940_06385 [Planctomycetes bacterium]|nr:hypothetical protein [Planctomycetota bacterium]